jgi:hypothetical protein
MKKIVFAMIEAGGGHKSPAKAVMDALEKAHPGRYELRMMDFIKDVGAVKVDASHKRSWKAMLEHPTLTHMLFQLENALAPASRAVMYRSMVAPAVPDTVRFIKSYRRPRIQHALLRHDGARRGEAPHGREFPDHHLSNRDVHLPRALAAS